MSCVLCRERRYYSPLRVKEKRNAYMSTQTDELHTINRYRHAPHARIDAHWTTHPKAETMDTPSTTHSATSEPVADGHGTRSSSSAARGVVPTGRPRNGWAAFGKFVIGTNDTLTAICP